MWWDEVSEKDCDWIQLMKESERNIKELLCFPRTAAERSRHCSTIFARNSVSLAKYGSLSIICLIYRTNIWFFWHLFRDQNLVKIIFVYFGFPMKKYIHQIQFLLSRQRQNLSNKRRIKYFRPATGQKIKGLVQSLKRWSKMKIYIESNLNDLYIFVVSEILSFFSGYFCFPYYVTCDREQQQMTTIIYLNVCSQHWRLYVSVTQ